MTDTDIIVASLALIGGGFSLMVIRDYRAMKRATRKNKNSVQQFIQELDNHDPTQYGKFAVSKGEKDAWAKEAIRRYNIPVGIDPAKAHLFDYEKEKENE